MYILKHVKTCVFDLLQTFTREYININPAGSNIKMESVARVRRTELRVSTVWTLEKFHQKLSAMRQLYSRAETSTADDDFEEEDVFCDPDDAWVADSPTSSLESSRLVSPHMYELQLWLSFAIITRIS